MTLDRNWISLFIFTFFFATLQAAGLPSSSLPTSSLPTANPTSSLPTSSLPTSSLPTSSLSSSTSSSSSMQPLTPLQKPTPVAPAPAQKPPPSVVLPPSVPMQANYFYPGIVVNRNGKWEGGDDLLNLTQHIGFYLSVIKPEHDSLVINQEMLKSIGENLFKKVNISPVILAPSGQPPLPFFQVQILIYPIAKEGYVACCEGRLFEAVNMQRIILDPTGMAFQAVTWQKSNLFISPNNKVQEQIQKNLEDIVQAFTDRYQAFENIKKSYTR